MSNTIQLKGDFIREEAMAAASTLPGKPVEKASTGKFAIVGTEGAEFGAVAVEDGLQGNPDTEAYVADNVMQANYQGKGNKVKMILKAGQNVAIGARLCVTTGGLLIAVGSAATATVVKQTVAAEEAVNLSASGAVDTFIAVRF